MQANGYGLGSFVEIGKGVAVLAAATWAGTQIRGYVASFFSGNPELGSYVGTAITFYLVLMAYNRGWITFPSFFGL